MRRARMPLSMSQGFHPKPRVNFSGALPTGEESVGEYMDVVLYEAVDVAAVVEKLRASAPPGFLVLGGMEVPVHDPGLMGQVDGASYTLFPSEDVRDRVWALNSATSIPVERRSKGGQILVDVRPMIRHLEVRADGAIRLDVRDIDGRPGKPKEILRLLGVDPDRTRILKRDVSVRGESPGAGWSADGASAG